MSLTKYDTAKAALADARSFDDILKIKDVAAAQAKLAEIAKDSEMILWATEIKTRAERRAGEMLLTLEKSKGTRLGGTSVVPPGNEPTLKEIGVTKNESSRWQALAKIPEPQFEDEIKKGNVTRAKIVRSVSESPQKPKAAKAAKQTTVTPGDATKIAKLIEENAGLKEWGSDNARNAKELLDENNALLKITEADDKLAAAMAEVKKLREENRVLKERNRSLTGEKNEAIRAAKMWQGKFIKLEKAGKR